MEMPGRRAQTLLQFATVCLPPSSMALTGLHFLWLLWRCPFPICSTTRADTHFHLGDGEVWGQHCPCAVKLLLECFWLFCISTLKIFLIISLLSCAEACGWPSVWHLQHCTSLFRMILWVLVSSAEIIAALSRPIPRKKRYCRVWAHTEPGTIQPQIL